MQNSEFNVKCEKILFFSLQKSKETELKPQFKGCIFSIINYTESESVNNSLYQTVLLSTYIHKNPFTLC